MNLANNLLLYLCVKYDFDWDRIYQAVREKTDRPTPEELQTFFKTHEVNPDIWVSLLDENYPTLLKKCTKPPFVINITTPEYRYFCEIDAIFERVFEDRYATK